MPWVPAAVAAGGAVLGGVLGSKGSKDAAAAQSAAAEAAIGEQRRQFNVTRSDQMPWMRAGQQGARTLSTMLGLNSAPQARSLEKIVEGLRESGKFGSQSLAMGPDGVFAPSGGFDEKALMAEANRIHAYEQARYQGIFDDPNFGALNKKFTVEDFYADPVTQLSLDYGRQGIERNLGARGMLRSGAMLKSLGDYMGTRAGESYGRFYGDQDRIYNRLAGISGVGQASTSQVGNQGMNMAGNVGNLMVGAGNARGAAAITGSNAWGNAGNTIGNYYAQQSMLDRILPQQQQQSRWQMYGED